jgi:rhamnosyltransferase
MKVVSNTDTMISGPAAFEKHWTVAILLATYNGAEFIEPQIKSLTDNKTNFTLHWLDDHSIDNTRDAVRDVALRSGVELHEWHQPQHLGVPAAFFQLLECVDADIYLFCDQDDIWQPGKIDATAASLLPDVGTPALCFSDPLMFSTDSPGIFRHVSDIMDLRAPAVLEESRLFMSHPAWGNTIGFTRGLRDLYLKHKDIARKHASMHDWWMYIIAVVSGTAQMLTNSPTALYRRHRDNFSNSVFYQKGIAGTWRFQQEHRREASLQARGFLLAAETLPRGPKLERAVELAKRIAKLDRRQTPAALFYLSRRRAMWPNIRRAAWLSFACLCSDAIS